MLLKDYSITKYIYKYIYNVCKSAYYKLYIFAHKRHIYSLEKKLSLFNIKTPLDTVIKLINSNVSMGRFGDGDISLTFVKNNGINDAEKHSVKLSNSLKRVLKSSNKNFIIGLPDQFISLKNYKRGPKRYWIRFINRNIPRFLPLMNINKIYYNTSVTRPYMDYSNKKNSGLIFYLMRKVWENKKVLIIEGNQSRVGFNDNLLSTAKEVKRIECPAINAFENINLILKKSLNFLDNNNDYITLLSLGATATILALYLSNYGYRAIDIGNLDLEYQWYLKGADKKINLPYKYVLEVPGGDNALPIPHGDVFYKEIIDQIN